MNKKVIRLALGVLLLALSFPAQAQQTKKVPRIGYLSSLDPATDSTRSEATRAALRELGYIEGQNIAIEYRYTQGKVDRAPELAAELVRLKVDIIVVAAGEPWIRATMNASKTIPIVMRPGLLPSWRPICDEKLHHQIGILEFMCGRYDFTPGEFSDLRIRFNLDKELPEFKPVTISPPANMFPKRNRSIQSVGMWNFRVRVDYIIPRPLRRIPNQIGRGKALDYEKEAS